jgi:hypothetical protein
MQYQDCIAPAQPADGPRAGATADARRLADANINPATGLATDYLNHFNEAIMLLEMLSSFPDCLAEFNAWRPKSYRQHFNASRFIGRDLAIAAYDAADPAVRERLETLAGAMNGVLEATRAALMTGMPTDAAGDIAGRAAALLRPIAARTGALINGNADTVPTGTPQAVIDGLMKT